MKGNKGCEMELINGNKCDNSHITVNFKCRAKFIFRRIVLNSKRENIYFNKSDLKKNNFQIFVKT